MRHPFDGIEGVGRRGFLAGLLGLGAGLVVSQMASAAAPPQPRPQASTEALHEEGGDGITQRLKEDGLTTKATGEEGGKPSTAAAYEEGGRPTLIRSEEGVTTLMTGEEGGRPSQPLREEGLTTKATNEEGGQKRK